MSLWEGKSKGTSAGYRFFVGVLKIFGIKSAYFLLRFVALYYFLFSIKANRAIYSFYRRKMGNSRIASFFKIYNNNYQLGQSIIDKVVVMSGIKNTFTYLFDGEENLHQIAAMKKGGILLSAHIGNWDIAGHLLNRLNARIHIVVFDGEHEKIKEYLSAITGASSINIISIKNDLSHIYAINEALGNNDLVCMHADRFLEGNKTLSTKFLGEEARFPLGPFVLASTFRVPVSYVFAMKESDTHYHFFASPINDYSHLEKNKLIKTMLMEYADEMEQKAKRYPDQWFNFYNFWN